VPAKGFQPSARFAVVCADADSVGDALPVLLSQVGKKLEWQVEYRYRSHLTNGAGRGRVVDNTNSLRQTSIKGSILKPGGCDQMQDSILIKSGDKGGKLLLYLA
jgi:hypothetical protein